jgi:hypothetical protein
LVVVGQNPHEPSYYIRPDVNLAQQIDELKGEIKQLSRTITNNTLILAKLEGVLKKKKRKREKEKRITIKNYY